MILPHMTMRVLVLSHLAVILVLFVVYGILLHRLLSLSLSWLRMDIFGVRRPVIAKSSCAS